MRQSWARRRPLSDVAASAAATRRLRPLRMPAWYCTLLAALTLLGHLRHWGFVARAHSPLLRRALLQPAATAAGVSAPAGIGDSAAARALPATGLVGRRVKMPDEESSSDEEDGEEEDQDSGSKSSGEMEEEEEEGGEEEELEAEAKVTANSLSREWVQNGSLGPRASALLATCIQTVRKGGDPVPALKGLGSLVDALSGSAGALALGLALRALRLEGRPDDAIRLFQDLNRGVVRDADLYAELLLSYDASERFSEVKETFDEMRSLEIQPTLSCYKTALRANAHIVSEVRAVSLLADMKKNDIQPDRDCYFAAMKSCNPRIHYGVVLNIFKEMNNSVVKPDQACYREALHAAMSGWQWEAGIKLYDDVRTKGWLLDEEATWFYLRACAKSGDPDLVAKQFKQIEANPNIPISDVHYDVLINVFARDRNWPKVLGIAARMGARGISPHEITSNSVLTACIELGKYEVALNLLRTMLRDGAKLDTVAYTTVMQALSQNGEYDSILELYEEISPLLEEAVKSPMEGFALIAPVIAALSYLGQEDEAMRLYRDSTERGWVRMWKRRRVGTGPVLLDARNIPPQLVKIGLRAMLQDVAQEAEDSMTDKDGPPDYVHQLRRHLAGLNPRPQDILVVVAEGELELQAGRLTPSNPTSASGLVLAVAREALGADAKLELSLQPTPCIRIPSSELQALLVQRVQSAFAEFTGASGDGGSAL
mmetsp:Transcript_17584/g.48300  ORF Transcript_17584/g.48300 Transcript_17584/m.48300 type:complete len:713 (-) Transcript_17584:112-2250(-)